MARGMVEGGKVGLVLVACVSLALAFAVSAPAAFGAVGVYDAFGTTGGKGGEFGSAGGGISGVAVNSTGNGAATAGDTYVLDRGNNRIQRFDEDGGFISAFGQDVVESGPGNNGTGFEICKAASGDVCKAGITGGTGGAFNFASSLALSGIAVNQSTGDLYVTDRLNRRVQQFDGEGNFIRAFGKNVVASGSEQADEQQRLTVDATAGQYKLTFGAETTTDIEWNEPAAGVEAKLSTLASLDVSVSKGPGGAGGTTPYLIAFTGAFANTDQAAITVSAGTTPLSGGAATATIATFNDGATGFEICEVAANCQGSPADAVVGGAFRASRLESLAVAPTGAPNAGNVLVADGGNLRVQEFTSSGIFVRTFGWDVAESGPSNTGIIFETCSATALDICKAGVSSPAPGGGLGQFSSNGPNAIAEDSSGNVYTTEFNNNFRVQKFTFSGNVVTPQGEFDPAELKGTGVWNAVGKEDTPIAVAVDTSTATGTSGTVYVLKYFPQGSGTPPLEKKEARILEVDPVAEEVTDEFTVRGEVGTGVSVTALALNTATKRLYVTEPASTVLIVDEVPPVGVIVDPAEAAATNAILKATITPAPLPNLHTFYRFEYAREGSGEWKRLPALPAPDIDIGKGPAPVAVSQKAEGLEINACYDVKAIAYSKYHGAEGEGAGTFCTKPIPPQVETGEARWSSPAATNPSLTLFGTVNPGKDQTSYFFQYVTKEQFEASGFAAPSQVPALPAPAGHGLFDIGVLQSVTGLDPTKTYVYRLVATNSVGTTGTEPANKRTVSPPDPNARFYELVSDTDSRGVGVWRVLAVSDDGGRVALEAQSLADPRCLPNQTSTFLAERGEGWAVAPAAPEAEACEGGSEVTFTAWLPTDLSTVLWAHYSAAMQIRGEYEWTFTDPNGTLREALPRLVPTVGSGTAVTFMKMTGAATDLSSFVFQREELSSLQTRAAYLPGQPLTTGGDGDIYRVSGAGGPSPTLTLLNRDSAGNLVSNSCGVWLGSDKSFPPNQSASSKGMNLRPVSTDGKIAYFSARPTGTIACSEATDRIRIFKRIEDTSTIEVSKAQCSPGGCEPTDGDDFFQGASANGNRVFFTTTRQLVNDDNDPTLDLYLYDSDPPTGQPNLVQASAKTGIQADVQESVVDISVDGSRAYFVAKGDLAAGATAGQNNLYVYQRDDAHPSGRIGFVAKLDSVGDIGLWSPGTKAAVSLPFAGPNGAGTGDGRFLLFNSKAKLLPSVDADLVADLYRYDDETATTICLSCAGDGAFGVSVNLHGPSKDPAIAQRDRIASEDLSRAIFVTAEKLLPEDENTVADAYLWDEGGLELVSTGDEASGGVAPIQGVEPLLSADGSTAFFITSDRILRADTNSAEDAYSARIGGGFPEANEVFQSCISADECRTKPVPPPTSPTVGSIAPKAGNPLPLPKSRCPKPKVRKKGRCVKKSKKTDKHSKSAKRRTNNDQGVER